MYVCMYVCMSVSASASPYSMRTSDSEILCNIKVRVSSIYRAREEHCLPECDVVKSCSCLTTFRRNLKHKSGGYKTTTRLNGFTTEKTAFFIPSLRSSNFTNVKFLRVVKKLHLNYSCTVYGTNANKWRAGSDKTLTFIVKGHSPTKDIRQTVCKDTLQPRIFERLCKDTLQPRIFERL
jgi:hypothetical protein